MTADLRLHEGHAHSARCYWDLNGCRWVCRDPVGDGNRTVDDERDAQFPMTPVPQVPPRSPMALA